MCCCPGLLDTPCGSEHMLRVPPPLAGILCSVQTCDKLLADSEEACSGGAQPRPHLGYDIAARLVKYFSMWSFAFFTGVATSTAFSTTFKGRVHSAQPTAAAQGERGQRTWRHDKASSSSA
jgi:hypothetical protein